MKQSILLIIACIGFFSCKQSSKSTSDTVIIETLGLTKNLESQKLSIDTEHEYTDSIGKSVIIQNSLPKGALYTASNGNEYVRATFWTQIINETDSTLEFAIDFSKDAYEFPSSVGSSIISYYKLMLPPNKMTPDKEDFSNYGLTDIESFLDNNIDKPSSLKMRIKPKAFSGFYVVRLWVKLKSDELKVKDDGNGTTRAGLSIKGQNLFYNLNGKEIHCGTINLNNLRLVSE
ncbi:MAG: hypothetical protein RH981_13270 [Arenibacter sp.]